MMNKKKPMSYKKGGVVFKPCASCPTPSKCRRMGACAKKAAAKKKRK